jgi:hypothetical protein
MIELSGAEIVFYGADRQPLAVMEVPVRLEQFGQVTLVVDAWIVPAAARQASHYQIRLPLPVLYEASPSVAMLASQLLPMPGSPQPGGDEA